MKVEISSIDNVVEPLYTRNSLKRLGYYKNDEIKKTIFIVSFLIDKKGSLSWDNLNFYGAEYIPAFEMNDKKKYLNFVKINSLSELKSLLSKYDRIIVIDKKQYKRLKIVLKEDIIDFYNKISKFTDITNTSQKDYVFLFQKDEITNLKKISNLFWDIDNFFQIDLRKYKTIFSYIIYKVNRKMAKFFVHKNQPLDRNFERLYNDAYKDVFVHLESRTGRKILTLDVNSMYPFLLTQEKYPHPKYLQYSNNITLEDLGTKIFNGMFRVKLKVIDDNIFAKKYNYLVCRINNYSINVSYEKGDEIETYLGYEEVLFYKKYFKIEIIEGIYSSKTVYLPIRKMIKDFYSKRIELKEEKKLLDEDSFLYNKLNIIEKIVKSILVSIGSATYRGTYKIKEKKFNSWQNFEEYVRKRYLINLKGNKNYQTKMFTILNIKRSKKGLIIKYKVYERSHPGTIHSIFGTMFSMAKVLIMKNIEKMLEKKDEFDLNICYSNIDSIHVDIKEEKLNAFIDYLEKENIISDKELGKMKIESIANKGLWLDIANYWLFNNKTLVKYANMLPSDKRKPFSENIVVEEDDKYGFSIYKKYNLFKNLKYWKHIVKKDDNFIILERPKSYEICNYKKLSSMFSYFLVNNVPIYKRNFHLLKNKILGKDEKGEYDE